MFVFFLPPQLNPRVMVRFVEVIFIYIYISLVSLAVNYEEVDSGHGPGQTEKTQTLVDRPTDD